MGARLVAGLLLGACLTGCSREPGVYAMGVHEVFTRLAENKLDDFKMKRQCGILIHFRPETILDKSITWRVYSSGYELLSFTANLTPVGDDKTKVEVTVSKDSDGTDAYAGGDFYPRPALQQPLKPAVEEAIAAELEGRGFDPERVPKAAEKDSVCLVQRGRIESGRGAFSVEDDVMNQ